VKAERTRKEQAESRKEQAETRKEQAEGKHFHNLDDEHVVMCYRKHNTI